ncbi:MAG: hypothetical protein IKD08_06370 [Alphaproteobacteria bacterium]|nr:hypothetical protein [Alphaproteobacteria bacterium]
MVGQKSNDTKKTSQTTPEKSALQESKIRQGVEIAGGILSSGLARWNQKEAEHYKALSVVYLVGFLVFLFVMIAFAYALFIYDASQFMWRDGTTMWGVMLAKAFIFVPLIILAWFFGHEFLYTKARYEMYMHRAFVFQAIEEVIDAETRSAFVKEVLISWGDGMASGITKEQIEAKLMMFAAQYLTKIPAVKEAATSALASSLEKKRTV